MHEVRYQTLRVLIVDDDEIMGQMAGDILVALGVGSASLELDGAAGLAALHGGFEADLILCDLNMPGMDGVSFMRELAKMSFGGAFALYSGESESLRRTASELAHAHALNLVGVVAKPLVGQALSDVLAATVSMETPPPRRVRPEITVDALREAISGRQLRVFYQPQISTANLEVLGVEALVRWEHPTFGLIAPDDFIPLAEDEGLIDGLTYEVCGIAMADYARMAEQTGKHLSLSVNLSAHSLRNVDLPDRFTDVADRLGVPHDRLVLEMTESHISSDLQTSLEVLSRLRLRGFKLSIDDFGTGYSSLRQLRTIPFNELKVDRSFVHGAARDESARGILKASSDLAALFGLHLVAEGVEDRADWDLVVAHGCNAVQGYYFCRPVPLQALLVWLSRWGRVLPEDLGDRRASGVGS